MIGHGGEYVAVCRGVTREGVSKDRRERWILAPRGCKEGILARFLTLRGVSVESLVSMWNESMRGAGGGLNWRLGETMEEEVSSLFEGTLDTGGCSSVQGAEGPEGQENVKEDSGGVFNTKEGPERPRGRRSEGDENACLVDITGGPEHPGLSYQNMEGVGRANDPPIRERTESRQLACRTCGRGEAMSRPNLEQICSTSELKRGCLACGLGGVAAGRAAKRGVCIEMCEEIAECEWDRTHLSVARGRAEEVRNGGAGVGAVGQGPSSPGPGGSRGHHRTSLTHARSIG